MHTETAQLLTRVLARRHPSLQRALVQAALHGRPDIVTHALCSWIFTGNSELQLPCDQ